MNYFSKLFNSIQALQYCPLEFLLFLLIYVIQTQRHTPGCKIFVKLNSHMDCLIKLYNEDSPIFIGF